MNPHQSTAMNPLWNLQYIETLTYILQHLKTQSYFKNRH